MTRGRERATLGGAFGSGGHCNEVTKRRGDKAGGLDAGTVLGRSDTTSFMKVDGDYLDAGGDDYGMLVQSPAAARRDVEATVLRDYLNANPQLTPAIAGRITQVP